MLRVRYVGHATVLLEAGGTRLLTDPVLRRRVAHLHRIARLTVTPAVLRPDAVLISHAHMDHLDPPSLRLLHACPVFAPRGCGRLLRRTTGLDVHELAPGDRAEVGALRLRATLVPHHGARYPLFPGRETLAYLVDGDGHRAFFAGDTDVFAGMAAFGGLELALVPTWGWGARVGRGHMGPDRAAAAAALLAPRVAVPIHWGTLASPRAPWLDDPARPAREFAAEAAIAAPGVEVRVLAPGEDTEITT